MDPPLFLSLMALFNMYLHVIAQLYAPSVGESDGAGYDIPETEKERRTIMSAFYETELEEGKEDASETMMTSRGYGEESGLTATRRDIKKPA